MDEVRKLIIARLEEAGRTIMQTPMHKNGIPAPPRSAWPQVCQNYWDVFGPAEQGGTIESRAEAQNVVTKLLPSSAAEDRCTEAYYWLFHIKVAKHSKIVAARMLMHPVDDRHIKTFHKLSLEWGRREQTVRRWHRRGIDDIVQGLE